jgi:hypothetical protein
MDVDARYPALAALAQLQGHTLNKLAKNAAEHRGYVVLSDCCQVVFNDLREDWPLGAYNYLATLDELIRKLGVASPECRKIWQKLNNGPPSKFLDKVVEAAWALYFWDNGHAVSLEKQFDPLDKNSKDADVVVTLEGIERWLDVSSVDIGEPACAPFLPLRSREELIDILADRARKKYREKFKDAVRSGPLRGCSVGVLLCMLKSVKEMTMQFWMDGVKPPPPSGLFSAEETPGLDLVYVCGFYCDQKSDILRPDRDRGFEWHDPKNHL